MKDKKQNKKMDVKSGDQSKKINHKGSDKKQGDTCCMPSDFDKLTGPEGAMDKSPKITKTPSKGKFPGDMGSSPAKLNTDDIRGKK